MLHQKRRGRSSLHDAAFAFGDYSNFLRPKVEGLLSQVADKEAGANCPAALVHAARTRSRLGGKVKRRFQEGAVDEVHCSCCVFCSRSRLRP